MRQRRSISSAKDAAIKCTALCYESTIQDSVDGCGLVFNHLALTFPIHLGNWMPYLGFVLGYISYIASKLPIPGEHTSFPPSFALSFSGT